MAAEDLRGDLFFSDAIEDTSHKTYALYREIHIEVYRSEKLS
ncbi:MAG: hypothetical protein ACXQT2_03030 [Methanotrichaceae archaeon]